MYDNMNRYTATFDGCSTKNEEIENLGLHTFVSADSGSKRVIIESLDFGGIDSFIGDDNKFFIVKYMGKMPKITYQYHLHDTELDTIFEIDPSGDNFGKLTFFPNDDLAQGGSETVLNLSVMDNYSSNLLHGVDNNISPSTFAVLSYVGTTQVDGIDRNYIGMDVYSQKGRIPILNVLADGLTLGSVSKRVVITLSDTTKLESFSMGTLKLFDQASVGEKKLSQRSTLPEMLDDLSYSQYHSNIRKLQKMLEYPNKIFNVDSQI